MRIAIVTTEFVSENNFDGGLANYTYKLAKWLIQNNHEVRIFMTSDKTTDFSFDGINISKVKVQDLKSGYKQRFEKTGLSFLISKRKLHYLEFYSKSKSINDFIKKSPEKFDIIHYPHISGLALLCPRNIPSIVRLSSSTKLCYQFGGYGEEPLEIEMQMKIEAKAMKKASAVFGPSEMIAAMTGKEIGRNIHVIETPYIKTTVNPDNKVFNDTLKDKKYVLFFGSISLIKGVGTIAESIHSILEEHQDIHFVFVGKKVNNKIDGKLLWDYLIEKSGKYHNRVIHIEPLKHSQLFPVIQNAECVVLPSRVDNFPNTCIESMANGKIVIGTKGNGFDQLIEDSKSGFIMDVDDSKTLAKLVTQIIKMPKHESEAIEIAAKKRIELLSPDIVLNQLLELYKKTIRNFKK